MLKQCLQLPTVQSKDFSLFISVQPLHLLPQKKQQLGTLKQLEPGHMFILNFSRAIFQLSKLVGTLFWINDHLMAVFMF